MYFLPSLELSKMLQELFSGQFESNDGMDA